MQRITRLLSGPPSRGRWGARAGFVVLLASGVLLVSQVGITGSRPGIRITSTTDGVLGPGDVREITAKGLDKQRYYRASVDAQGQLTEFYKEDGQERPIDRRARAWIAEVTRLSAPPPPPPIPPLPPPPPIPELPPVPAPPELRDSTAFKDIMRLVAADSRIVARLGTPVVATSNEVHGRIAADGWPHPKGDADLRFQLGGPKGQAMVSVSAELVDGAWTLGSMQISPAKQ